MKIHAQQIEQKILGWGEILYLSICQFWGDQKRLAARKSEHLYENKNSIKKRATNVTRRQGHPVFSILLYQRLQRTQKSSIQALRTEARRIAAREQLAAPRWKAAPR
jgi:hypothetical protein